MTADKSYNVTTNGEVVIPVPTNPASKWLLCRIVVNKKGASSNVAVLYDSNETLGKNSELKKGTIDTTDKVTSIEYGLIMVNGIFLDVNTGTAPDLTIIYKEIF